MVLALTCTIMLEEPSGQACFSVGQLSKEPFSRVSRTPPKWGDTLTLNGLVSLCNSLRRYSSTTNEYTYETDRESRLIGRH